MTDRTMTERMWARFESTYQPVKWDLVPKESGHGWKSVAVDDGPRRKLAHKVGPKLGFVLLAIAHVMDTDPYPDVVTSEVVAAVTGLTQSVVAKALAELTTAEWLESFTRPDTRSTKYYRIIGA
jgi:hypothetical protein